MDLIITILPVVTKDLPISPRFTSYNFLTRCKFSTLTTRQPMVGFYLLTFPRFPLRKKEHKSYFGKNRTHDFRTSRCAGYLLDHSGDQSTNITSQVPWPFLVLQNINIINSVMETADKHSYLKCYPNHRLFEKLWDLLKDCAQPACLPDKPAGGWGKGEAQKLNRVFRPYKKKDGTIR